ncbi:hypothetical protein EVAR_69776_1 [Eumeta japonica]|uniref:Uncharacterized protein n=1 Tax=Eumeta variegata TaxID=151549 RepID=A0A4C2A9I0_EUMVA|nr:hypothetical protein EVAR_69776_1 [Eumeta japonica]
MRRGVESYGGREGWSLHPRNGRGARARRRAPLKKIVVLPRGRRRCVRIIHVCVAQKKLALIDTIDSGAASRLCGFFTDSVRPLLDRRRYLPPVPHVGDPLGAY